MSPRMRRYTLICLFLSVYMGDWTTSQLFLVGWYILAMVAYATYIQTEQRRRMS